MQHLPFSYIVLVWTYRLVLLLVGIVASLRLMSQPTKSIRWLCMLIIGGALTEGGGYIQMRLIGNNLIWYTGYSILNLFCVVMYFFYSVRRLQYKGIGKWMAYGCSLLGLANSLWWQPLPATNTNFLFFSSALIICLSFFALTRILVEERIGLLSNIHFWIAMGFVTYWFFLWLCYGLLHVHIFSLEHKAAAVSKGLVLNNLIVYVLFGILLLRFNKFRIDD